MLRESRYLSVIEIVLCGDPLKSETLASWKRWQDVPLLLEELGSRRLEILSSFFKKSYKRTMILSH
jgi:hypothetical protein